TGLKTLADAIELRNRIYGAFEEAERAPTAKERKDWMTFVVVGGGATGVEVSGQLALVARIGLKREFRHIDPADARVILIDAGERIIPAFSERLSAKAAKGLGQLGVAVRERGEVTAIDERGVTLKNRGTGRQQKVAARTVI